MEFLAIARSQNSSDDLVLTTVHYRLKGEHGTPHLLRTGVVEVEYSKRVSGVVEEVLVAGQ